MKTKLVVCEPQCFGLEHAHFNASLLETVLLANPKSEVLFLGERQHISCVAEVLAKYDPAAARRVVWEEISISPRGLLGWARFRRELGWVRATLDRAATGGESLVVLCSVNGPGLVALKLTLHSRRDGTPVLAVVHSVLQTIFERLSPRPSTWILNMRHAMALPHPRRLRYIALGASLYRNLRTDLPRLAEQFASLELPCLMDPLPEQQDCELRIQVRFGFLGVSNSVKRFEMFAQLAADTLARVPSSNAEFTLVGYLGQGEDPASFPAVSGISSASLTAAEYNERAMQLTYVVSTSDPRHYRFLASATFLDALAFGKPGIFLRNPYIEHYFALMGDIGYLCDSYEEMLETIVEIVREFPTQRYREQCRNIRRHRAHFTPRRLARQFREIASAATR